VLNIIHTIGSIQTLNTIPCDLVPVVSVEQSYALMIDPISIPFGTLYSTFQFPEERERGREGERERERERESGKEGEGKFRDCFVMRKMQTKRNRIGNNINIHSYTHTLRSNVTRTSYLSCTAIRSVR
jgi:hypothetical protein